MMQIVPFLTYVFVTTFTPGPNNILSMSNAMRFGYKNTLRFLLGITCGFLVVMLLSGLANVILINLLPQVHFWLGECDFNQPAAPGTFLAEYSGGGVYALPGISCV